MRLADPWYLILALVALPLILLFIKGIIGQEAALKFSNVEMVHASGARNLSFRRFMLGLLRAAVLLLLLFALARPQTGEGKSEETKKVVDVMIAVDISSSMATLDFHPDNRLVAAKMEAERFIRSRPDDRMGLVIFAKHSLTVSPLTTDHAALLQLLKRIQLGLIEDGTAIGVGLANAVNRLRESEAKSKVAILLTDGINNSGEIDPLTAGDIAKELGIRVYTIGMGIDGQALIPIDHPRHGRRLVQTYTEIDEGTLTEIAKRTGGLYFRARDEVALRRIFEEINKLEKTEVKVHTYTTYNDYYPFFLKIAFAILMVELILSQIVWRKIP